MFAYVEIWKAGGPELVPIEGDRLTIGKAASNDLSIDSDPTISRLHAVLERFPAGWSVRDLSSRNGTFVNGQRVFADRVLRSDDEIRVGRTRLVFKTQAPGEETMTEAAEPPPSLSDEEASILLELCRPLLTGDVFTEPASDEEIARAAGIPRSALTRHVAELARKFGLDPGADRLRATLANESIRRGAVTLADLRAEAPTTRGRRAAPATVGRFAREGEYWTIEYGEDMVRLRDSKGLQYLEKLLAEPGREFHVMDLAVEATAVPAAADPRADSLASTADDAGAILDPQAKAAYRQRLQDLEEEAEDAEALGDPERAARAREERDAIVQQLAAAVGLGGRDRKAASVSERHRVNVTRAIRSAIDRIAEHSEALGKHLDLAVRTGTFCMYAPTGGDASWTFA